MERSVAEAARGVFAARRSVGRGGRVDVSEEACCCGNCLPTGEAAQLLGLPICDFAVMLIMSRNERLSWWGAPAYMTEDNASQGRKRGSHQYFRIWSRRPGKEREKERSHGHWKISIRHVASIGYRLAIVPLKLCPAHTPTHFTLDPGRGACAPRASFLLLPPFSVIPFAH